MEVTVAIIDERASFGIDTSSHVVREAPAEAALPGALVPIVPRCLVVYKNFTSERVQTRTNRHRFHQKMGFKV